jgi:LCP family protein required for cell wall assembly
VTKRRRRGPWLVIGQVMVAVVSIAALTATGMAWYQVEELQQSVNTTNALTGAAGPDAPPADDGAEDFLVVGNDTRTDLKGNPLSAKLLRELRTEATETINTDTLILLRVPHNGGRSYGVSIPRDTYVKVPDYREEKINGAFGITKALHAQKMVNGGEGDREKIERESDNAGRTALAQSVQGLTGVRIDHYIEITMYGFYLLTEAIGGVDVCLNRSTSDTDSGADFRKGNQTIRGGDAVAFVRQRKGLPRGDLDRIVRQQTFLSSAMNKVLSGSMLTDPGKLNALQDAVSKAVVMDPDLHFLDLVNQAQTLASGAVEFVTIPVTAVGARNERGQSIITVDLPAVHAFVKALATGNPPPTQPPPTTNLAGTRLLDFTAPAPRAATIAALACVN